MLPAEILASGFDGFVATAGAYVECGGAHAAGLDGFRDELAARALELLDANGALYILETPTATFTRQRVVDAMVEHAARSRNPAAAQGLHGILDALTVQEDLTHDPTVEDHVIRRVRCRFEQIAALIGPEVDAIPRLAARPWRRRGRDVPRGVNKATGIAPAIAHLGLTRDDVMACGDGPNDLEMLEFAGTSVVIEGSAPELLALADLVAAGPEHAGLVDAFVDAGADRATFALTTLRPAVSWEPPWTPRTARSTRQRTR